MEFLQQIIIFYKQISYSNFNNINKKINDGLIDKCEQLKKRII